MPRAGVTRERIVTEALVLVDESGFDNLTLAGIAARLGIRVPSLYKHVTGLPEVQELVAEHCRLELATTIETATDQQNGAAALRSLADAVRQWALTHPGRYAATVKASSMNQAPTPGDQQATRVLLQVISGPDTIVDDATIHRARALRAALHGFVDLELKQGFGLPTGIDASWNWLIAYLIDNILPAPARSASSDGAP